MPTTRSSRRHSTGSVGARRDRTDAVFIGALILAVAGSALGLAGTLVWLFLPIAFVTMGCALGALFYSPSGSKIALLPAVILVGLGAVSLLQTIPLPISVLARLSPAAADIWSRCLLPAGQELSTGSLSLDPSASTLEAVKWIDYAATFYLAAVVARARGAAVPLVIVFGTAVAIALISIAHGAAGAQSVYGVYRPQGGIHAGSVGPILNPNVLSSYLNLGALVGVGLAFSRKAITSRWVLGAGVVSLIATSLRTGSRGGVGAIIIGIVMVGVALLLVRGANKVSGKTVGFAATGFLAVCAVMALIGADRALWAELLDKNIDKVRLVTHSGGVIRDYPWFGIGRGAFESVFQAYRPEALANVVFTHPENFLAQWATEWGLPVALSALGSLTWCFVPWKLGVGRSATVAASACGLAVVLIQNLADLGLEVPAQAISFATVLGALWGGARDARGSKSPKLRVVFIAGLGVGVLAFILCIVRDPATVREDRATLHELLQRTQDDNSDATKTAARASVIRMSKRHPADYYFPLGGATLARVERENPMPWIQRALERGPTAGRTHFLLAQVLAERGYQRQAMIELKLAVTYEPSLSRSAAPMAARLTHDPELLMVAIPEGAPGAALLDLLADEILDPATREILDAEALRRDSSRINPRQRLVDARIASLQNKTALCADAAKCIDELESHAAEFERIAPNGTRGPRIRASIALIKGDSAGALKILQEGCNAPAERTLCFRMLVDEVGKPGVKEETLAPVLDAYAEAACVEANGCADAHALIADIRRGRGETQLAVSSLEKAAKADPSVTRWLAAADLAHAAGLAGSEVRSLEQASRLEPKNEAIKARLHELRMRR